MHYPIYVLCVSYSPHLLAVIDGKLHHCATLIPRIQMSINTVIFVELVNVAI